MAGKAIKENKKKGGLGKWFSDIKLELKKVTWPGKKRMIDLTIIVLFFCLALCVVFYLFDTGIYWLFDKLIYAH